MRTSLLAAIVGVHAFQGTRYTVAGGVPRAIGNHHPSIAPYGLFHYRRRPRCRWPWGSEGLWKRFAPVCEIDPDDPRFATNDERVANRDDVIAAIEQRFAADTAEVWLQRLAEVGVPAGKVRTLDDVFTWEQTLSQGLLIEVDHPTGGRIRLPGPPLRFDDSTRAGGARSTCRRRGWASTTRACARGWTRWTPRRGREPPAARCTCAGGCDNSARIHQLVADAAWPVGRHTLWRL